MLITRRPIGTIAYLGGIFATPEDFTWSWGNLIAFCYEYLCQPNEYVHQDRSRTTYHSTARNGLAKTFLGDWLWTTDTDHAFDPDILARMVGLMKKYDLDVVSGLYRYKVHPYLPVAFHWSEETQGFLTIAELDWNAMLQQVSCVGAGCLLIKRRVFERVRNELGEELFDIIPPLSEDFSAFTRLRKLGIPVYISPVIESYHLRVHKVTNADYDRSCVVTMPIPTGGEIAVGKR